MTLLSLISVRTSLTTHGVNNFGEEVNAGGDPKLVVLELIVKILPHASVENFLFVEVDYLLPVCSVYSNFLDREAPCLCCSGSSQKDDAYRFLELHGINKD